MRQNTCPNTTKYAKYGIWGYLGRGWVFLSSLFTFYQCPCLPCRVCKSAKLNSASHKTPRLLQREFGHGSCPYSTDVSKGWMIKLTSLEKRNVVHSFCEVEFLVGDNLSDVEYPWKVCTSIAQLWTFENWKLLTWHREGCSCCARPR